jgi:hypothetical protein
MASESTPSSGEYEFNDEQNRLIGSLARKMSLVGFVLMLFGVLQVFNGVMTLIATRSPDKVLSAAKDAGMTDAQLQLLETSLKADGWLSPITISALTFALAGLLLIVVGLWTQQAAAGFAAIVLTKGQDIRRLMDALGALHKRYGLIYNLLWIAAIAGLISFGISLYHLWSAKGS